MPGLGMADHFLAATPKRQANFRQLGSLARTGFPRNDDHLVPGYCARYVLPPLGDRQVFGKADILYPDIANRGRRRGRAAIGFGGAGSAPAGLLHA